MLGIWKKTPVSQKKLTETILIHQYIQIYLILNFKMLLSFYTFKILHKDSWSIKK